MTVSIVLARRFSAGLFRLHGAKTETEVGRLLAEEADGLKRAGAGDWLLDLLREHADCRCNRLRELSRGAHWPGEEVLTRREQEVLHHVALGQTDAAIGRVLGIATKTVSKHVEHILDKLGVETRAAAVAAVRAPREA